MRCRLSSSSLVRASESSLGDSTVGTSSEIGVNRLLRRSAGGAGVSDDARSGFGGVGDGVSRRLRRGGAVVATATDIVAQVVWATVDESCDESCTTLSVFAGSRMLDTAADPMIVTFSASSVVTSISVLFSFLFLFGFVVCGVCVEHAACSFAFGKEVLFADCSAVSSFHKAACSG